MKDKIIIVSKMHCGHIVKKLAEDMGYMFCNLLDIIEFDLGNIDNIKKLNGEDYYLKQERKYLKDALEYEKSISFVSYDIYKHNLDINLYKDVCLIMLDFGYFIRRGDDIVRMAESVRYQKAKSLCDEVIDCRNSSEDNIIKKLKGIING